jgi:transposase-like protein
MYGLPGAGNISVRARYGAKKTSLLYCKTCGATFSENKDTPLEKSRLPVETVHRIIDLAGQGRGIRSVGRELGLSPSTVLGVMRRQARHCAASMDRLLKSMRLPPSRIDAVLKFMERMNLPEIMGNSPGKPGQG